ncbi:MAG: hypothetical protein ABIZ04_11790 [Opitutus sp.]
MIRFLFVCLSLLCVSSSAQSGGADTLAGRMEGRYYVSPTGAFKVLAPVLPELGGRIVDTDNVVTFQDDYNVLVTIAAFPLDATLRWELSTRGQKDFLAYFFANYVLPDFQQSFAGAHAESAKYAPSIGQGGLLVYLILPGGSMFANKLSFIGPNETIPDAKRGNLLLVRDGWTYVVSIELAERVLERSTYKKTTVEEDEILRQRLIDLVNKMEFTKPPSADR